MTDSPSCTTCDFMRHEGPVMRCYWDTPQPALLGQVPNRIQGGPPVLIITGISPEVSPERFCRHHPALRMEGDVQTSPGMGAAPVPRPSLMIDGNETRQ